MATIQDRPDFNSWTTAFKEEKLAPEQLGVLQAMVDDGEAATLLKAAQLLDWHETVLDPVERYYGL